MHSIELRQKVRIRINGKDGEVRGVWTQVEGQTQYRVRYVNQMGSVIDDWFIEQDLELLAE